MKRKITKDKYTYFFIYTDATGKIKVRKASIYKSLVLRSKWIIKYLILEKENISKIKKKIEKLNS